MDEVLQPLINGLVTGGFYALIGGGLSIIWGTLDMVNIAHGDFYMLGGFIFYMFIALVGVNPWLAILITLICMFVISMFIETVLIRPLMTRRNWEKTPFVITMGLSIFLQNFALRVWGERYKTVPYLDDNILKFWDISISAQRVIILAITVAAMLAMMLLIKKTRLGWAIRASSQNKNAATLVGINAKTMYLITFALACTMAALAGCLLAPIFGVNPWMGTRVLMKAFVVCVLGGLGSFEGAVIAGLLLGTVESFTVQLVASEWKDIIAYIVLIIVLWVKPTGLFGKREGR